MSVTSSETPAPSNYEASSALESSWADRRPMPEIAKPSPLSASVGFVIGALVVLGVVGLYSSFFGA